MLGKTIRKRVHIGSGRSLCRPRRHVRRNCFAQFEQRAQIGVHKLQDQRERTGEIPGLRSRYHRTTAPAELEMNNALEFEEPERLAQRRARHLVAREHVFLLRQPVTDFRSEEHTSELQSLMRISYAVFCLQKTTKININYT